MHYNPYKLQESKDFHLKTEHWLFVSPHYITTKWKSEICVARGQSQLREDYRHKRVVLRSFCTITVGRKCKWTDLQYCFNNLLHKLEDVVLKPFFDYCRSA